MIREQTEAAGPVRREGLVLRGIRIAKSTAGAIGIEERDWEAGDRRRPRFVGMGSGMERMDPSKTETDFGTHAAVDAETREAGGF